MKRSTKKHIKKYPERRDARNKLNNAKNGGAITQQPCVVCGDNKVHAHHPDYSKPLDVVWLCQKHHVAVHSAKLEFPNHALLIVLNINGYIGESTRSEINHAIKVGVPVEYIEEQTNDS